MIQYIDILMGAIFNALHWESQNEKKENLAFAIQPLLLQMINNHIHDITHDGIQSIGLWDSLIEGHILHNGGDGSDDSDG